MSDYDKEIEEAAKIHASRYITDTQWQSQDRIESFTYGAKYQAQKDAERINALKNFCIKYFSLNVFAMSGEHVSRTQNFKEAIEQFIKEASEG